MSYWRSLLVAIRRTDAILGKAKIQSDKRRKKVQETTCKQLKLCRISFILLLLSNSVIVWWPNLLLLNTFLTRKRAKSWTKTTTTTTKGEGNASFHLVIPYPGRGLLSENSIEMSPPSHIFTVLKQTLHERDKQLLVSWWPRISLAFE